MQITIHKQRGEFNLALAGTIAAIIIGAGAFLYANETSQHLAAQQASIQKLQTTVAALQDQVSQASGTVTELQANVSSQSSKLDDLEKQLQTMKEEAHKPVAKPKAATKHKTPVKKSSHHKKK
jgi:peptidoglycan hydrolase CwlO-like protein